MIAIMLLISDDTLFITNFFAVDICIDNVVDVEVDLVFGLDRPQPLFYFVPQDSHSQAGSTTLTVG